MEILQQIINEVARLVGRMGCNVTFGFNPECTEACEYDPLNDPVIDESGPDRTDS